jgi:hypothetical protein
LWSFLNSNTGDAFEGMPRLGGVANLPAASFPEPVQRLKIQKANAEFRFGQSRLGRRQVRAIGKIKDRFGKKPGTT